MAPPKQRGKGCIRTRQRMIVKLEHSHRSRCCCCACLSIATGELREKNLMIGICCKTSPLYSRCTRLALLMLGALTDMTICALFFNLDPNDPEYFYFWDNLVSNIWVGFFSAVLSIPPLLFVVLAFKIPSKILLSFEASSSIP